MNKPYVFTKNPHERGVDFQMVNRVLKSVNMCKQIQMYISLQYNFILFYTVVSWLSKPLV